MKKIADTGSSLIRHDYQRACYRAMLSEFSAHDVIEFFSMVPLIVNGKTIEGAQLFNLLWADKGKITPKFDYGLDNRIERFVLDRGKNPHCVLQKILWLNNTSTYIPGKVLLTWFYPRLESVFNAIDTRDMVFALMTLFTENLFPNHVHRRIKRVEKEDWTHSVMIYNADPPFPEFINMDLELIAGPQVLNGPVMFGLPLRNPPQKIIDSGLDWIRDSGGIGSRVPPSWDHFL